MDRKFKIRKWKDVFHSKQQRCHLITGLKVVNFGSISSKENILKYLHIYIHNVSINKINLIPFKFILKEIIWRRSYICIQLQFLWKVGIESFLVRIIRYTMFFMYIWKDLLRASHVYITIFLLSTCAGHINRRKFIVKIYS